MSKKWKFNKFRISYILVIFILLISALYFRLAIKVSQVVNSNNPSSLRLSPSPSPSPYLLPTEITTKPDLKKYMYSDNHISFEFPLDWKIYKSSRTEFNPVTAFYFVGNCGRGLGAFSFNQTDKSKPDSYKIGQKNQYGPSNQLSGVTKIGNLTVGTNVQPTGDGSGGYEPGYTVDFLSNSKNIHYYFVANLGCRDTFQMTYEQDILSVLKSVKILE